MLPSMMREGIFTMGYLGIEPMLEHYSNMDHKYAYLYKFGCAMCSGFVAAILSHPFDTIKTCMQGDINKSLKILKR